MSKFKNTLNLGLQATVPILLTIAILVWLVTSIEAFFGFFIKMFVPTVYYYKGMGAIFGFMLVFSVGFLMNAWFVSSVYAWLEVWVKRIPLVKTIYQSIQDVLAFFDKSKGAGEGQTVVVELPMGRVIGFITCTEFKGLELGVGAPDEVAVFIPLSYQIGGFTVLMPRSLVKPISMPAQEAMRFVLTAGVVKDKT